jgi:hypothetical protein
MAKPLVGQLRELNKHVYFDTAWLLLYSIIGSLAPFFIAWGVKAIRTTSFPSLTDFAHAGEFALYTAGFVASTAYLLGHDRQKAAFPGRLGWLLLCGILIGASIVCYMLVAPDVLDVPPLTGDSKVVFAHTTIWMFGIAVALYFAVALLDATRALPDVRSMEDRQVDDLSRRVNELPN